MGRQKGFLSPRNHEEGLLGGEESWQSPRRYNEDPEEGQLNQREGVRKGNQKVTPKLSLKEFFRASLVVQWLGLHLPVQGTQV